MANIIRIKRGTTTPTTSSLTQVGEMAIDTSTNDVFIRGTSSVIKINSGWTILYEGGGTIPTTLTAGNITLNQSINLYGKILAFEVRNVIGTDSYETMIVYGRMGNNTTATASATYDRLYSWTAFDGQYLKIHSFKAYVTNAVSSTMTIGNLKHLVGNFNGTSISWTTNTTTSAYIEKIWLVN